MSSDLRTTTCRSLHYHRHTWLASKWLPKLSETFLNLFDSEVPRPVLCSLTNLRQKKGDCVQNPHRTERRKRMQARSVSKSL